MVQKNKKICLDYGNSGIQNKHLSTYFRCSLSVYLNNWCKLVCQNISEFWHSDNVLSSFFGFKTQIPISLKLGLVGDDNDFCQPNFCQSILNHTTLNTETSHSCLEVFLSSKNPMDLLRCETQYRKFFHKAYRKVRDANHRSLSYRSKCKLAKPLRVGQQVLPENHNVSFGK